MNKKQVIIFFGVAIVVLIGSNMYINSQKAKQLASQPTKAEQAKTLIDKVNLLYTNGGVAMSDDAVRIFNANATILKSLSSQDLDSLISVLNKILNNTASDSEKEYLTNLSDNLSL